MFKIIKYIAIAAVVGFAVLMFVVASKTKGNSELNKEVNNKAIESVKANPQVIEAFINEADYLYVSVNNQGKDYNQFASYMCNVMKANGGNINKVRVMQVNTINHPDKFNAYGVLLGEWTCK